MDIEVSGDAWRALASGGDLFDLLPLGAAVIGADGRHRSANRTWRTLLGVHSMVPNSGRTLREMLAPDVAELLAAGVADCRRANAVTTSQREVRVTGGLRLLNLTFVPGPEGAVGSFVTDVTCERDAVRGDERFRKIFHESPIGAAIIGSDGSWMQVNAELASMMGVPEEALLGKLGARFFHPTAPAVFERTVLAARESVRASCELRMIRHNGDTVQVEVFAARVVAGLRGEHYFVVHFRELPEREDGFADEPTRVPSILVVDEEPSTAYAMANILRDEKLPVTVVTSPETALKHCLDDPFVELVIIDLRMPSAEDLILRARAAKPDLKVLCVASYTPRLPTSVEPDHRTIWLPKPFDSIQLVQTVRRTFNVPARRRSTAGGRVVFDQSGAHRA